MEAFLGVRFLVSEYGTGSKHLGRIDSLGLDGAPADPDEINTKIF